MENTSMSFAGKPEDVSFFPIVMMKNNSSDLDEFIQNNMISRHL